MPSKPDIILSDKEKNLLDFIKNSKVDVTIKLIEEQLGSASVGALGKISVNASSTLSAPPYWFK